ncbi:helix-turn-helix domain-containing protein [Amnibacterium setariae]|uniref:DNA-binding protein n=1 Tax=Amnibacterium setariae TaxID=2306585 RepID=A0A3A1TS17_9MICO|nr:helix-turn-helix domain-containing protein [Amnibacterium setariae]RIX26485.1 DNA-binding protein [Amnibacterium setariae]
MSDEKQNDGRLLSKAEAVEYLGGAPITIKTIEALVRRREIGFLKIGRALVFPKSALDAYIAEHTVQPSPNPWGLTDAALRRIREDRSGGRGRTF